MIPLPKITSIAKECFIKSGTAMSTAFIETGKGELIMAGLMFENSKEKLKALDFLRNTVHQTGSEHYVTVNEAWIKKVDVKNEYPLRAGRYVDREECLLITEFKKGHDAVACMHPIIRGDTITFGKEQVLEGNIVTIWNVFLEKEGVDERIAKDFKSMEKQFFENQTKKFIDKYRDRFYSAKTDEDKRNVLKEMTEDIVATKREHDKKIYEDSTP